MRLPAYANAIYVQKVHIGDIYCLPWMCIDIGNDYIYFELLSTDPAGVEEVKQLSVCQVPTLAPVADSHSFGFQIITLLLSVHTVVGSELYDSPHLPYTLGVSS